MSLLYRSLLYRFFLMHVPPIQVPPIQVLFDACPSRLKIKIIFKYYFNS
jgi:hypothetical protein